MSYYSSKHPGLYLYLALASISMLSFLYFDISSAHIGILAMLWGAFTALRTLSLYEVNEHYSKYASNSAVSKNHNGQTSALAHDLVHRMSRSMNMKGGLRSLCCLHERTILWFALALIYTAFQLHISAPVISKISLMETMCTLFMIGAAFWGGQSYAHSDKPAKLIMLTFGVALALSLFSLQIDTSVAAVHQAILQASIFDISTPHALLVLLVIYSVATLSYALIQKNRALLNVFTGIALIIFLAFCHLTLEPSYKTISLWISGWGLFSVFWIRAYQPSNKRYILYQCE